MNLHFKGREEKLNNYLNIFVLSTVKEKKHLHMKYYRANLSIQEPIAQHRKINEQIVTKIGHQFGQLPSCNFLTRLVDILGKERFTNHSSPCYSLFN